MVNFFCERKKLVKIFDHGKKKFCQGKYYVKIFGQRKKWLNFFVLENKINFGPIPRFGHKIVNF